MKQQPRWFLVVAAIALLWNVLGLSAVIADVRLSAADIAALPANEQALRRALPAWCVVASVVAVIGGVLGCLGLLLRRQWALFLLYLSAAGVVLQEVCIFGVAGGAKSVGPAVWVLQGLVLAVAIGLVWLGLRAKQAGWLA
jgi:hypothetical protein